MAIDPAGLVEGGRLARDLMRDYMLEFGMLAISRQEIVGLRDLMTAQAPTEWTRWKEVIMTVPHVGADLAPVADLLYSDLVPRGDAPTLYSAGEDVADPWLGKLDSDVSDGHGMVAPDVEVVRVDSLQRSHLLDTRRNWRQSELPPRTARDDIWVRLQPLVVAAKRVVVIDPYALSCGVGCIESTPRSNGVEWLFERIAGCRSPVALTIFGHVPDPPFESDEQLSDLADHLWTVADGTLIELELVAVDGQRFRQLAHDRTLRFINQRMARVVTLGDSLDALTPESLRRSLSISCHVQSTGEAERSLEMEERLARLARQSGSIIRRSTLS